MFNLFKNKSGKPDWSFQLRAISSVVGDFQKDIRGRFLLVLPTGGGKTITAIRSLSEMFNKGHIAKDEKVLWVVHTLALYHHAKENFENEKNYSKFSLNQLLKSQVDVKMKADAVKALSTETKYKIIVIDEAHHAAADTYSELFEYPLGILGLTATPRRMDHRGLPFQKVSYSITFRELVHRRVVLLPKFLPEVRTEINVDATSLQDETQLEKFNNEERNKLISHYIFQEAEKYNLKKIIVFAGTNLHVKNLFETIENNNIRSKYKFDHVGYIYGGNNNDKNIANDKYLKWHHSQSSSVLVNCKILNEGYDDPNIDTVVMATPTNSILYYMQCIGRVVRTPEDHVNANAYVIEIVDRLPNVSYRIDNRWLFAEISDYLEPRIEDFKTIWPLLPISIFWKLFKIKAKISDLTFRDVTSIFLGKRVNLILFNDVPNGIIGQWRILSFPENAIQKIEMFNDLSENIEEYYNLNHDYLLERNYPDLVKLRPMNNRVYRSSLIAAMRRASNIKDKRGKVDSLVYLSIQ
ncbi:MAG TPA: DEAD/DEAH box helicase family protein [Candidatus Paceibacterota bacterium]